MALSPLTWSDLSKLTDYTTDPVNGPTNAQAQLRLFGGSEDDVRVTLYRDNHAWCPYCQKIWLWLEEKRIPYRIRKVTMFCYGEKEKWYKRIVPSGMLPAVALDGQLITESDDILVALEDMFGPVTSEQEMDSPTVVPLRRLERLLFRAWCGWLCQPLTAKQEARSAAQFQEVVNMVEKALADTPGPYFLSEFGTADIIFTPYVERMNASLYYYKGYSLRSADTNPRMSQWFDAMETRPTYRGTQSDFHTHAHDLPPQMGGCYDNGSKEMMMCRKQIDEGPWNQGGLPDAGYEVSPEDAAKEALYRVLRHQSNIISVNPVDDATFDEALRCALTYMMTGKPVTPPGSAAAGLRYLRDRINVPRDMSVHAAKKLRGALEDTAALVGTAQGPPIPTRHRRDQNPMDFRDNV